MNHVKEQLHGSCCRMRKEKEEERFRVELEFAKEQEDEMKAAGNRHTVHLHVLHVYIVHVMFHVLRDLQ